MEEDGGDLDTGPKILVVKRKYRYRAPRLGESFQAKVPLIEDAESEQIASTAPALLDDGSHQHRTRIATGSLSKKVKAARRRAPAAAESEMVARGGLLADNEGAEDLRPHQLSVRDGLIWDPAVLEEGEVDDFLLYSRSLLEATSHTLDLTHSPWRPGDQLLPIEADEEALHYLYQQRYNTKVAQLRLTSELGVGREYKFLHALDTLYQCGANANSLDRRDRSSLIGAYASGDNLALDSWQGNRPRLHPYSYRYPTRPGLAPKTLSLSDGVSQEDKKEVIIVEEQCLRPSIVPHAAETVIEATARIHVDEHEPENSSEPEDNWGQQRLPTASSTEKGIKASRYQNLGPPALLSSPADADPDPELASGVTLSEGRKKRAADKQEAKRHWTALLTQAELVIENINACRKRSSTEADTRSTEAEMYQLLQSAEGLPDLQLPPGDETVRDIEQYLYFIRETLAKMRKWTAKIHDSLNTTASQPPTLDELKELLRDLRAYPVVLQEEGQLTYIVAEADAWNSAAQDMMRHMDKATLSMAQDLAAQAECLPVRFDRNLTLTSRIEACLSLGKQIINAMPPRVRMRDYQKLEPLRALMRRVKEQRLKFPEGEYLGDAIRAAQRWTEEAQAALCEAPDLRKLTHLLEDAGHIPVDLSELCNVIQLKVDQAHRWVDKVRKALPKKNKTRTNVDAGKVDYEAARTLLTEGNSMQVDVRELQDMAGVMDTAETWLQRVRDAMEQATDEAGLTSLQALLTEADDIPVEMDEYKILAAEIEARRWGLRVQPRLDNDRITMEELQKLIDEAAIVRSRLPLSAKDQRNWRLREEVAARKRLDRANYWLKDWKRSLLAGGSGFKKGMTLQRLIDMIDKAQKLSVNLGEELKPLQSGLTAAEQWYNEWQEAIRACGVSIRPRKPTPPKRNRWNRGQNLTEGDEEAEDETGSAAAGKIGENEEEDDQREVTDPIQQSSLEGQLDVTGSSVTEDDCVSRKLDPERIAACLGAAAELGFEIPEAEDLKVILNRIGRWREDAAAMSAPRHAKRRASKQGKATLDEVEALLAEGKRFPVDLSKEMEEIGERKNTTGLWQAQVRDELELLARDAILDARGRQSVQALEEEHVLGVAWKIQAKSTPLESTHVESNSGLADKQDEGVGQEPSHPKINDASIGLHQAPHMPTQLKAGPLIPVAEVASSKPEQRASDRIQQLHSMIETAADIIVETPEEEILHVHLEAHQWCAHAAKILQEVDPSKQISDEQLLDLHELLAEGNRLLGGIDEPSTDDEDSGPEKMEEESEEGDRPRSESPMAQESSLEREEAQQDRRQEAKPGEAALAREEDNELVVEDEAVEDEIPNVAAAAKDNTDANADAEGTVCSRQTKEQSSSPSAQSAPHNRLLHELIGVWWERLARLRVIRDRSRAWIIKARRRMAKGEKAKMSVLQQLVQEASQFDFKLERMRKLQLELERAASLKDRALAALQGDERQKPTFAQLKSLILEAEKCRVIIDEVKDLRKHFAAGHRWLARFQRAKRDDLEEMSALSDEGMRMRIRFTHEMAVINEAINRCCFCRQVGDAPTVRCSECGEKYHLACLEVREQDADIWQRRGWCCPRCLVRWHMRDALAKTMIIVQRWIQPQRLACSQPVSSFLGLTVGLEAGAGLDSTAAQPQHPMEKMQDPYEVPPQQQAERKVQAWMKRLLHAAIICAERDSEEVRTLGSPRHVKKSVLVEVIKMAKTDSDVERASDVQEAIWNLSVVFWGARLICQLRRRPSFIQLQALTAEMRSVGIHNEPLQVMLNSLLHRAHEWRFKAKPVLQEAWIRPDARLNIDYLSSLLREKRRIPVRLNLERRLESILADEIPGKRYCHCRGFYDGLFMVQCSACHEWFHGKCVQLAQADLDQNADYCCPACCELKRVPYRHKPYRPPDPDIALDEAEDCEEEQLQYVEEDEYLADKHSLEGIFPCKQRLLTLDIETRHINVDLLPLLPDSRRKQAFASAAAGGPIVHDSIDLPKKRTRDTPVLDEADLDADTHAASDSSAILPSKAKRRRKPTASQWPLYADGVTVSESPTLTHTSHITSAGRRKKTARTDSFYDYGD